MPREQDVKSDPRLLPDWVEAEFGVVGAIEVRIQRDELVRLQESVCADEEVGEDTAWRFGLKLSAANRILAIAASC